jgi:predicted MPP superfamily phosphohydrolase
MKLRVAVLYSFLLVSCATTFVTENYHLESVALNDDTALNIVLISDLHSNIYGEDQSPLIEAVREARPDLIFLAGDIVDDKLPMRGTELLLTGIRDIAPMFYVTGNHEYMSNIIVEIRYRLENLGVIILSDRWQRVNIRGNEILVAGIEDPFKKKKENRRYDQEAAMEENFRSLDGMPGYKILIAHRPENIDQYRSYNFDLVVSGHAHGGQWRIPGILPNGLYAPHQGLFPAYTGGQYNKTKTGHAAAGRENGGETVFIVSRGLSMNRPRFPRINNPPELAVIHVVAAGGDPE